MKASDYIAEFLVEQGVGHVFGITGGAIIHAFDSVAKRNDLRYICPQHEQAAAMAADGYARITKNLGATITTSGPGATNLLTGTCCSYYDSIPVLNITGQVATNRLRGEMKVRQIGFQETPIAEIFAPVTKYSVLVKNPEQLRYELEKAVYIAKSGRPGPVVVDIPDDIQRAEINPVNIPGYVVPTRKVDLLGLEEKIERCFELIKNSERPLIVLGAGVKLGNAEEEALKFVRNLGFPTGLTWATRDMMLYDDELNAGGFGITSQRYGNFAIQNADLVVALGTRMDTHHTGTPLNMFARGAKKVLLDIDESELEKFKGSGLEWDLMINSDVRDFLEIANGKKVRTKNFSDWKKRISNWKINYPSYNSKNSVGGEFVDSYSFLDELSRSSAEGDVIITDAGGNLAQTMGGYEFRKKQILFSAFNHSPMGNSLPESIGACFARDEKPVICIIGDGGLQMNIQELATLKYHNLPVKVFVFNNQGYGMIQQTQDDWLNSRYVASSPENGIAVPDFVRIGEAYGLRTEKISNQNELSKVKDVLNYNGPILCEVNISPTQRTVPMLKVGRPIEDAKPLLPRKEFLENMVVEPLPQCLKEDN